MAGYFTYSISWDVFRQFVDSPTDAQIAVFADALDDQFEEYLADIHQDGAPMPFAECWSTDGEHAEAAIRKHLRKADWYAGLDEDSQSVWSDAIATIAENFDFRVDSDGIYWNLIEFATKKLSNRSDKQAVARFGRCPYSVESIEQYEPKNFGNAWWDPYHSMHSPDEVKRLIDELESLQDEIMKSTDEQAIADFRELMPALEAIRKENRMLYVRVDT